MKTLSRLFVLAVITAGATFTSCSSHMDEDLAETIPATRVAGDYIIGEGARVGETAVYSLRQDIEYRNVISWSVSGVLYNIASSSSRELHVTPLNNGTMKITATCRNDNLNDQTRIIYEKTVQVGPRVFPPMVAGLQTAAVGSPSAYILSDTDNFEADSWTVTGVAHTINWYNTTQATVTPHAMGNMTVAANYRDKLTGTLGTAEHTVQVNQAETPPTIEGINSTSTHMQNLFAPSGQFLALSWSVTGAAHRINAQDEFCINLTALELGTITITAILVSPYGGKTYTATKRLTVDREGIEYPEIVGVYQARQGEYYTFSINNSSKYEITQWNVIGAYWVGWSNEREINLAGKLTGTSIQITATCRDKSTGQTYLLQKNVECISPFGS